MSATEVMTKQTMENDANKKRLISKRRRVSLPQWATAWIVLIPAMIFILAFMIYPIINTFLFAFIQNYQPTSGVGQFALGQFVAGVLEGKKGNLQTFGFINFYYALSDSSFTQSILNTALLTIIEVPLTIMVSLLIATFLNSIKVLKGFYQTIFFLPYVTNTIALGVVFSIAFTNTPGGLMNIFLKNVFGVEEPINWLNNSHYTFNGHSLPVATKLAQGFVIVLYSLWNGLAFKVLVFMAGLATIDSQYYNAAKIDGANNFTIWRRITLPLLSPQILYITITSFIGSFKMYTGVSAVYSSLTSDMYYFGGEGEDWITVVGWIYKNNQIEAPGKASAASLILLAIIMVITLVQFLVSKKKVNY